MLKNMVKGMENNNIFAKTVRRNFNAKHVRKKE